MSLPLWTILWDAALLDPLSEQLQRVSQKGPKRDPYLRGPLGTPFGVVKWPKWPF